MASWVVGVEEVGSQRMLEIFCFLRFHASGGRRRRLSRQQRCPTLHASALL